MKTLAAWYPTPTIVQSRSQKQQASLPYLWVPEELRELMSHLSKHFHLNTPEAKPTTGYHIIALQTERSIRRVLRKLQATPETDITIFPAELLLFESPDGLLMKSQPVDQWWQITKNGSLEFPDALAIARDALLSVQKGEISQSSWNLEKEELRQRCGVSAFDWNKYIRDLEAEVHGAAKLDIVERFKADLLTLAGTDDPIVQLLKINELAATYRMPAGEIRKALAKVETATRTPKAKFFALDEFLSMEMEGIDYLIPGLLPRGETVLCVGLPKSGKTLLAIDAAFAIATGESNFLGEQVKQGRVLFVSVDESEQSTKLKLIKRGFRASDTQNIAVMTTWDVSQMGELEAKLEDFRPDLVVIDSLKRITVGQEISENSAEFADIIYQLKELLGRYGASSILIHHSNKSQDAIGVGKVRGSTAIAGACWGVWQLDHIIQTTNENGKPIKGKPKFDPSDPRRIFTATCRDTDNQTLTIQFNPEDHSYSLTDEGSELQQERKTQEELILELLEAHHPNGLTGKKIMEALELGRSIYTVLDRMVSRRTVTQRQSEIDRRSMVYALPKRRDTHPPSPSLQMLTKTSESTVVEPKINSQQIVNNESPDSQRRFDQNEGVDYSIAEQMDISEDSQQLLATGGGVSVVGDVLTELNNPELSHAPSQPAPTEAQLIQVGDRVNWLKCPADCASFAPFEVMAIDGTFAKLNLFEKPVPVGELRKA